MSDNADVRPHVGLFIDWYLPGFRAGGPIQSMANLVAHLSSDFRFSVITRDTDYTQTTPMPNIVSNAWNELENGTRVYYFSFQALSYSSMLALVQAEGFDAVYVNGIFSRAFSHWPLKAAAAAGVAHRVIGARGMLAPGALAQKAIKKRLFLWYARYGTLFSGCRFHATNAEEAAQIGRWFPGWPVHTAGNLSKPLSATMPAHEEKEKGVLRLVSIARIAPEKNLSFALECILHANVPVRLSIYGPVYDEGYWQNCLDLIKKLPVGASAQYHGSLPPSEAAGVLARHDALFLPTLGENFGHIVLEAFQAGVPVLISNRTPWRNLQEKNAGWDLPLEDPKAFADALDKLVAMGQREFDGLRSGAFSIGLAYAQDAQVVEDNRRLFMP